MAFRKRLTRRQSKRSFRRGAGVHRKNFRPTIMRGGYRI